MVEVSLINCLHGIAFRLMSLELTENKSGALNDLVFIPYCRVIREWLPTCRQSVGDQLGSDRQPIGDRSATVSWVFVFDCRKFATFWRSVGDWSAISRRIKTVSGLSATAATGRQSVANQSATSWQPVGDDQKPFYDRFGRREVSLAATKTSLPPNRPCNLLQPVGDQSATSLQPPCNLPVTTRNFGRKEVADRLQAMCDRGFTLECTWETLLMNTRWKRLLVMIVGDEDCLGDGGRWWRLSWWWW